MAVRFSIPQNIYFGRGALEELKNFKGKKAVIVLGGGSMKRFGFVDKALAYLKEAGIETRLIENVEPDPTVATVMRGAKEMLDFNPDWIIAMGGGSPMDAAKAMWVFYEYPETKFEDIIQPFSFPTLRTKAKFCGIASTSGTASEVTAFAVITDPDKGIKYPLADFNITPDVAIVDPDLADTMPEQLTAFTGMDALTHATEAYVSKFANVFTDDMALRAIKIVISDLAKSVKGDKTARENMHYGQCLAGIAFSNALLGITHSMAHKTGAVFSTGHITHGLANAIYLPYTISYNRENATAKKRYAEIADYIGLPGKTDDEKINNYINLILELNKTLGIPHSIKELGVIESEFKEKLPKFAADACDDACTPENPRDITPKQMEELFTAVYYGKLEDVKKIK